MSKTVRFDPDAGSRSTEEFETLTMARKSKPKRFRDAVVVCEAVVDFAQVRLTPVQVLEIAEAES